MQLITGRTGVQHVKAVDDAEIYRTLLGDGDFILSTGAKMNAQMNGTNEIDIYNGTAIMQGRQVKIRPSEGYNAVSLDNGVTGYKRWDVVCIEYTKEDDIESAELVVIKGANSTNYVEPTVSGTSGSIDNGETHRMKLWGVKFNGINFDSLVDYRVILNTTPIQVALDTLNAYQDQLIARVESLEAMAKSVPQFDISIDELTQFDKDGDDLVCTFDEPLGYTYENTDIFDLYLNGLRILPTQYTVEESSGDLVVTLVDWATGDNPPSWVRYSEVYIRIWRAE